MPFADGPGKGQPGRYRVSVEISVDQIRVLGKSRLTRKIGRLSTKDAEELRRLICEMMLRPECTVRNIARTLAGGRFAGRPTVYAKSDIGFRGSGGALTTIAYGDA
jgi:hypothetical protein